jgi:hypothetical protein
MQRRRSRGTLPSGTGLKFGRIDRRRVTLSTRGKRSTSETARSGVRRPSGTPSLSIQSEWRQMVNRRHPRPPAVQLLQDAVGRRRAGPTGPIRGRCPFFPIHLCPGKAVSADQAGSLIGEDQHTASIIAPAHPQRQVSSEASGAVEEDQKAMIISLFHTSNRKQFVTHELLNRGVFKPWEYGLQFIWLAQVVLLVEVFEQLRILCFM